MSHLGTSKFDKLAQLEAKLKDKLLEETQMRMKREKHVVSV